MDIWEKWEFSPESEDRLSKICVNLERNHEISIDLLALFNYNSEDPDNFQMQVDDGDSNKLEDVIKYVKMCLESGTNLQETAFFGISLDSLSRVLLSINAMLDEFGFCLFCKFIPSWSCYNLIEQSLRSIVLERLKQTSEASGCVIFSIKELAIHKPEEFCQIVLIPLLTNVAVQFSDVELLSNVFSVLPTTQKDSVTRIFTKKTEFVENDWRLLHIIVKDLSQESLLNVFECIQKFSHKYTKSVVFGRLLVNFCRNFGLTGNKGGLREVVEKHDTLLKTQALKYLESV